MCLLWAQKQPRLQDFLTKMRTRASLIPNLDYEIRKKKEHITCETKIQQGFITKNKFTKIKGYDKKKGT
jgi:hypothetical protein